MLKSTHNLAINWNSVSKSVGELSEVEQKLSLMCAIRRSWEFSVTLIEIALTILILVPILGLF
jgi:hypothetical protein